MTLPTGGNACQKSTDDEAAQVYVAWLRSPEAVRSRIIGYVWDSTAPAGTICKSQKTSTVTYIVLRSGSDELGKWITERRNVVEDFRKIDGEAPDNFTALCLGIDSDDTRSSARVVHRTDRFHAALTSATRVASGRKSRHAIRACKLSSTGIPNVLGNRGRVS